LRIFYFSQLKVEMNLTYSIKINIFLVCRRCLCGIAGDYQKYIVATITMKMFFLIAGHKILMIFGYE